MSGKATVRWPQKASENPGGIAITWELSMPCDITKGQHTKLGRFSTCFMRGGARKAGE